MSNTINLFGDINQHNVSEWDNVDAIKTKDGKFIDFRLKSDPSKHIVACLEYSDKETWYVDSFMCKPKNWWKVLIEMYNKKPFVFLDDDSFEILMHSGHDCDSEDGKNLFEELALYALNYLFSFDENSEYGKPNIGKPKELDQLIDMSNPKMPKFDFQKNDSDGQDLMKILFEEL